MKFSTKAVIMTAVLGTTIGGLSTAAMATDPSPTPYDGSVSVTGFCMEGVPYVTLEVAGETDYALLQVNGEYVTEGSLADVKAWLSPSNVFAGDEIVAGIEVGNGMNVEQLLWSTPYVVQPCAADNGTVVSITETACDMVSTPALEGAALLVVQDIFGGTSEVIVTGLAAGVTSGNVDDGTEMGLPTSITISACTEVTNPGGGSTPASTPASSTTANPVVRAKVPDAGTDWVGDGN